MKKIFSFSICLLCAGANLFAQAKNKSIANASGNGDLRVQTASGIVEGVRETSGVRSFKGIPYAMPPVGNLRWREPQAPSKWQGVRAADTFGNDCVQHRKYDQPQSEDCLFLNVWTPADAAGRLP